MASDLVEQVSGKDVRVELIRCLSGGGAERQRFRFSPDVLAGAGARGFRGAVAPSWS